MTATKRITDPQVRLDNYKSDLAVRAGKSATSLGELMTALQVEDPYSRVDWTSLPWFGGGDPSTGTSSVWSGDATHLLVGTCAADLEIVSRRRWAGDCESCGAGENVGLCEECEAK